MNIRDNFPGTEMKPPLSDEERAALIESDLMVDIAEDLARELPDEESTLPTMVGAKRILFNRAIANERTEKAAQQAIAAAANAKVRQLTVSIRSLEDALDSLLAAEA